VTELQRATAGVAGEEWPKPLPVVLAPAPDEALSSWVERHAAFCGLGPAVMRRHCAPEVPSLRALDRTLTLNQEGRLSRLFRLGRSTLRQMTHAELGPDVIGLLVARDVDHRCERCTRLLAEAGFSKAIPRAWFHTWRITCPRCGSRVSPARLAIGAGGDASPNLFPDLWAEALKGERLINAAIHHQTTAPALPIPAMRLLRLLMIWTGSEQKGSGNATAGRSMPWSPASMPLLSGTGSRSLAQRSSTCRCRSAPPCSPDWRSPPETRRRRSRRCGPQRRACTAPTSASCSRTCCEALAHSQVQPADSIPVDFCGEGLSVAVSGGDRFNSRQPVLCRELPGSLSNKALSFTTTP